MSSTTPSPGQPPPSRPRRKNLTDYIDLGRGPMSSAYRRQVGASGLKAGAGFFERLSAFSNKPANWRYWASHVLKYVGHRKHEFWTYPPGGGVYSAPDKLLLSVAGDWGTGTDEAKRVADRMKAHNPDYTIHLGDVYYVGDEPEIEEHCLDNPEQGSPYAGVEWPHGSAGSFALNGNHEMYAKGTAYFDRFLKTLGPKGAPNGQEASFFCLQTEHWKVIGLDTGYNSAGAWTITSFLSAIKAVKWFRKTTWLKPSAKLEDKQMDWLRAIGGSAANGRVRGIVLLSHHQYYSGFDEWYQTLGKQLAEIFQQPVLWFWGHEHRMAIYDKFGVPGGIEAFGRCVGHGGMPVDRGTRPDIPDCRCILYDDRKYPSDEGIDVGYNGFVDLAFDGPQLRISYYDLDDTPLLRENWTTDSGGRLKGPMFGSVRPDLAIVDPDYVKAHS